MQPVYAQIALADGSKVSAICKFPTRENRAPAESVINEWMGTRAASVAGVQVPTCHIVEASPHVMLHLVEQHGITVSSHFGFASEVCQIDSIIYPSTLDAMPLDDLTRLYCFDMLFINADRTPNNPNCGHSKRRLFAYDFGSSLISPGTSPSSFERFFFGPGMNDRANAHLCREHISSPEVGQTVMAEMMDRLHAGRWYAGLAAKFLPQELQDHLGLAVRYLDYLNEERDMLCRQIVCTI